MPAAFDLCSHAQGDTVSSLTFNHTITGNNPALFVGVGSGASTPTLTTSVTWNGTAMTEVWDTVVGDTHNSGHTLAAPATGTHSVVVTLGGTNDQVYAAACSASDVDTVTPFGTAPSPTSGNSTTATITVSNVGAGDLVVSNLMSQWSGSTPGANETEQGEEIILSGVATGALNTQPGSAGGVMSNTQTAAGFNNDWVLGAITFRGVASVPAAIGWRNNQNPRLRGPIKQSRFQRTQLWSTAPAGSTVSGNGASSNSFVTVGQLSGLANLTGKSAMTIQSAGSGSGTGAMSGASSVTINTRAAGSGNGALTGASCVTINTRAAGSGKGALSGAGSVTINTSGAGSGKGALSGQSTCTISTGGTLTSSAIGSMIGRSVFGFAARVSGAGLANMTGNSGISESSAAAGSGKAAMTGRSTFSFAPQIFLQALTPISGRSQMNLVLRALMTGLTPPKPSWLELPLSNAYRANEISSTPRDNRIESEYRDNRITTEEAR